MEEKRTLLKERLKSILLFKTEDLKEYIKLSMESLGYNGIVTEDFLFFYNGNLDDTICYVAHIDTVDDFYEYGAEEKLFEILETVIGGKTILFSSAIFDSFNSTVLGGDDRCGVFILLEAARELSNKGNIAFLFTDGEESGGIGAYEFLNYVEMNNLVERFKCFIEFDRKGSSDYIAYNYYGGFKEFYKIFEDYGFIKRTGSFSDVSILDRIGAPTVNLSCGYYNQHTNREYVVFEETLYSLEVAIAAYQDLLKISKMRRPEELINELKNGKKFLLASTGIGGKSLGEMSYADELPKTSSYRDYYSDYYNYYDYYDFDDYYFNRDGFFKARKLKKHFKKHLKKHISR